MRRTERFVVGERPRIEMHLPAGALEVRTGAVGTIEVVLDVNDPDDVTVTQVGDTVSIRQNDRWGFRSRSTRALAIVPPGSEVDLSAASADVRSSGVLGPCRVRTASGDITVEQTERLELTTSSGDVRVGQVAGDVTLNTTSGDVTLDRVGGRLTATLVSGDLRANRVAGELRIGTTSGDIRVDCCDGSEMAVKTVSGDLELGLPTGIRVDADLSTLSGRARLPDPERGRSEAPVQESAKRVVRLAARTVSGDITIRRAG